MACIIVLFVALVFSLLMQSLTVELDGLHLPTLP
jgi:hypothetical protein